MSLPCLSPAFRSLQMAFALIFALLGLSSPARADEVLQDAGVWDSALFQASLHKPDDPTGPRLWLDVHTRRWGAGEMIIVRPAVGWDLSKAFSVYLGYAWVPTFAGGKGLLQEHRVFEQLIAQGKVEKTALQARFRLEERFGNTSDAMGLRLRVFGRAGVPIHGPVGLAVTDEVFVQLNDTSVWSSGFDQNRAFIGPYFQPTPKVRFEVGYMNVYFNRDTDTDAHLAAINLAFTK